MQVLASSSLLADEDNTLSEPEPSHASKRQKASSARQQQSHNPQSADTALKGEVFIASATAIPLTKWIVIVLLIFKCLSTHLVFALCV